jgi:organic hydroperoxide reductase OsmC/OhrA
MATRNGSVFDGTYSFSSRFEEGEGTNPEELIAAPAHVHLRPRPHVAHTR